MATGLQVLPLAFSLLSSSSSSSTPLNSQCLKKRTSTLNLKCYASPSARNSPEFPTLTYDPNDPFVKNLASVPAKPLTGRDESSDYLPFLDLFTPTKVMSAAGAAESAPPPAPEVGGMPADIPPDPTDVTSTLFYNRVVYIGMPLVSIVSELVVAQLLYLQADRKRPIYMYINSTGTTTADGEPVALESEGFAIYDMMMQAQCEIHTVAVGVAVGQALMLLAAGTKGKRFMMPHAKVTLQQPCLAPSGLIPASEVEMRAKEAVTNRSTFIEILAEHTGNSIETVTKAMKSETCMDYKRAKEFGVVDEVYTHHETNLVSVLTGVEQNGRT